MSAFPIRFMWWLFHIYLMAGSWKLSDEGQIIIVESGGFTNKYQVGGAICKYKGHVIAFLSTNHSVCSLLPLAYVLARLPLMVPLEPGRTLYAGGMTFSGQGLHSVNRRPQSKHSMIMSGTAVKWTAPIEFVWNRLHRVLLHAPHRYSSDCMPIRSGRNCSHSALERQSKAIRSGRNCSRANPKPSINSHQSIAINQ